MRIEILDEAQDDLNEGFEFYQNLHVGLGVYFLDCLFSDIDSLLFFAGVHQIIYGYHRSLSAFSLRNLLQLRARSGSGACHSRLSKKSVLDQKALEAKQLTIYRRKDVGYGL